MNIIRIIPFTYIKGIVINTSRYESRVCPYV